MGKVSNSLIIAVDGGGSTSRASVADWSGKVLGRAVGKPANITTDFENTRRNILETVANAYATAGLSNDRQGQDFGYLGLAGANVGDAARRLEQVLNFRRIVVTSDRDITVQGALGDREGTVALIGTGSFFVSRGPDETRLIGGWGMQVGDDASGARIGQDLLRQCLLAHDRLIEHSPLSRRVLEGFDGVPQHVVAFAATASPADYARYAPDLIAAYRQGDVIAAQIIDAAIARISHTLSVLDAAQQGALYMLGGLGPIYQEFLPAPFQSLCQEPRGDGLDGAVQLAMKTFEGDRQ